MDYMLLIYCDEANLPPYDPNVTITPDMACERLVARLRSEGRYIAGDRLHPTATATSVQVRNGGRLVTDGPFAETREQLAGYLLFRADNLDEAIRYAAMHPVAEYGTVEVRPVMNMAFAANLEPASEAA